MKKLRPFTRIALGVSALALISAYYVPLWQILMWAPQYPEGLEMKIWINTLTGDVKIISALNHYIGMKIIDVSMFPEYKYMNYIVGFIIATGVLASIWNRMAGLIIFFVMILLAGIGALVDFWLWGYDYGHNLNPEAAIKIEGMSYQPPLIGTKVLLNFTAFSGPDIGGWIFMGAGLLLLGLIIYEWRMNRSQVQ
jgi:copper chaperone NosL